MNRPMPIQRSLAVTILILLSGLVACAQVKSNKLEEWSYRIVQEYPHDVGAFTQGLIFHEGKLLEGTGRYQSSTLRRVDWKTGLVEQQVALPPNYFGEGIAIVGDSIYQLTWQNRVCIVYDAKTFERKRSFDYAGEGWGLTYDGKHLVMSDGTSFLQFINPETFQVVRKISAHFGKQKIQSLNELEYVQGEIWANVWQEDRVARLSVEDGRLLGWINFHGLHPRSPQEHEMVLNGIAYEPATNRLLVTGKYWPKLFEIEIVKTKP
jgi:glutaminyl-peptide cyclotransferase